jgi:demethylmenaquinone methyltransferase/2-methoxy-6-polyprenyl-1,4-benzoquinol methylase
MTGKSSYIQKLLEANPLRAPLLGSIIQALGLPPGSCGLDLGCGIGLQTPLLAQAVGSAGRIVGMDILTELLTFGKELLARAGNINRITLCAGDASRLPFDDDSFDWAWSADCIGYPLGELAPFLEELVRVVRPGGSVILLAWSSQQLLPGYPFLEARLNATCSAYIPYLSGADPQLNFLRALRGFNLAGLDEVKAHTFVGDLQTPLSSGERTALISLFNMLWGQPQPGVAPDDWGEYQRLCMPASPDFILDIPDYYAFYTYSVFRGKVPHV